VAVVVLGDLSSKTVGESASRTSLDLPGPQLELVQAVQAVGEPVLVVLINGRPLSINRVERFVPGILEAWFPGAQGGPAIADALFGDYNPGGKLTVTFPKTAGRIPLNFPAKPDAQWEGERTRVKGALHNFGHGLSYTSFALWDRQMHFVVEPGRFKVMIGSSCEDIRLTGKFSITD
jgi:beta-glucosidase